LVERVSNNVVMDANYATGLTGYNTKYFHIPSGSLNSPLTLISDPTVWTGGAGPGVIPATSEYVGNPWFCPGTPANAYILFQAQNGGSQVGNFGQPGGG
jgi:hypothetical protein